MSRVRELWRTMRKQPFWLRLLLSVFLVAGGVFALFLFYAFVVIAIFGI
jgi:hypothetical protein